MTVARSQHPPTEPEPWLHHLLTHARTLGASDVHLRSHHPPWCRVHGHMHTFATEDMPAEICAKTHLVSHDAMHALLQHALTPSAWAQLQQGQEVDMAWSWPTLGRYRAHAFVCASGWGLTLRCIDAQVRSLAELCVPPAVPDLLKGAGLVLVTGPTGSGKSTTLAAMVAHLNAHTASHVLTLEDPIEFLHTPQQSLITQREIGRDSPSFAQALRAALREDPDVLMVGEMRDLDTIGLALTAAETGHLVLASLHSRHAAAAVERIIDVFDASEKSQVRTQLAEALRGVLAQHLVSRVDASGRCALYELLVVTPAIRHLIREGKTNQIASAMQTGAAHGMVTMAQSQQAAERAGLIQAGSAM